MFLTPGPLLAEDTLAGSTGTLLVHSDRAALDYWRMVLHTHDAYLCTITCVTEGASLARHPNNALPADLPAVFRWREAHEAAVTDRRLKRLTDDGTIEKIEHGLYRRTDSTVGDLALIEIALLEREATLCLASALSHADLIDDIPSTIDIALKRGTRKPKTSFPITWHWFSPKTFSIGRTPKNSQSGLPIASYSPERSICDAYRMSHIQGAELGREALRNWIRQPGSYPAALLEIASHFPKAKSAIRRDFEILL